MYFQLPSTPIPFVLDIVYKEDGCNVMILQAHLEMHTGFFCRTGGETLLRSPTTTD